VAQRVRVLIRSADRFSTVGLTGFLLDRPEITLVTAEQHTPADVAVVADELTELREADTIPVVLVLNEISEANPAIMTKYRVVAVLPRAAITRDLLLRNVLAAAAGQDPTLPQNERKPVPVSLTTREAAILRLMADGLDTAKIASKLSYSEGTVKNVFYSVTSRLNLRNRPHAVAYALRKGLI
jgi:DNA-binding NarL/FixJ family response regulator